MYKGAVKNYVKNKLLVADIALNGNPPLDIQVNDDRLFCKVAAQASLGLGEAYVEGWFDAKQLDESIKRILESKLGQHLFSDDSSAIIQIDGFK